MIEYLNDYLHCVYTGHKYAYVLLVILSTTAIGSGMEAITKMLVVKGRT